MWDHSTDMLAARLSLVVWRCAVAAPLGGDLPPDRVRRARQSRRRQSVRRPRWCGAATARRDDRRWPTACIQQACLSHRASRLCPWLTFSLFLLLAGERRGGGVGLLRQRDDTRAQRACSRCSQLAARATARCHGRSPPERLPIAPARLGSVLATHAAAAVHAAAWLGQHRT